MDIYKIAGSASMLALCWLVQVWGLSTFLDAMDDRPPSMPAFTMRDIPPEDGERPLVEIAAEQGVQLNDLFITEGQIQREHANYQKAKWLGLAGTISGALGGFFFALRIWGSYFIATLALVIGPLSIAFVEYRQSHRR